MRSLSLFFLLAALLALPIASPAQAEVSAKFGEWTFTVSGAAGGFGNYTICDKAAKVGDFYVACANGPDGKNSTAFSSGLVPGHITFEVKTTAAGWDVGGALGYWSNAASSGSGTNGAFGFTKTDQRQNYVTFGKKDLGTTMPPVETALVDGALAWRMHKGGHTTGPNLDTFVTWAARYLKNGSSPAND